MKCYLYNSSPIGSKFTDSKGRQMTAVACHLFARPYHVHSYQTRS